MATFHEMLKIIESSPLQNWASFSPYSEGAIVKVPDGRIFIALNPLDENDVPLANSGKDPTNSSNNIYWKEIIQNFGS